MADLQIIKPQNENEIIITPQAEDRLVLDFNPSDVLITRDNDNLIFSFEDNKSRIILEDFYVAYSSENMPEFEIQGALVPGVAFFEALSDELMPAAGPAASTPQGGGTIVDTETTALLDAQVEGLESSEVEGFYASATPLSGFPDFAAAALADADAASVVPLPGGVTPPPTPPVVILNPVNGTPNNDDNLNGTNEADLIQGFAGKDIIDGLAGNDVIYGGADADIIYGGTGDDRLFGDYENTVDDTQLSPNDDFLDGGEGNDFLFGGGGEDTLLGGLGNDFLLGSKGDYLYGDEGFDVIKLDGISITDVFALEGGDDIDILLSNFAGDSFTTLTDNSSGIEVFINGSGVDNLAGETVADMYASLESVGADFNETTGIFTLDNNWSAKNHSQTTGLVEYTNANDDLTILINSTMVTTA